MTVPPAFPDLGCGTGDIARDLVGFADRIDAVDSSLIMLEEASRMLGGDDPRIRWIHARAEEVTLRGPYGLVNAGQSLPVRMDRSRIVEVEAAGEVVWGIPS